MCFSPYLGVWRGGGPKGSRAQPAYAVFQPRQLKNGRPSPLFEVESFPGRNYTRRNFPWAKSPLYLTEKGFRGSEDMDLVSDAKTLCHIYVPPVTQSLKAPAGPLRPHGSCARRTCLMSRLPWKCAACAWRVLPLRLVGYPCSTPSVQCSVCWGGGGGGTACSMSEARCAKRGWES